MPVRVKLCKQTANELKIERTTDEQDLGLELEDPNKQLLLFKKPALLPN